jgi:adenylate cyclase
MRIVYSSRLFRKSVWHADNILKINPLSPNHYFTKANIHYLNQDYTKAIECIETSLSINPDFTHSIALKQLCLILLKDYEKLNDFLGQTPLVERPEECRVLYKLVNPEDKIDIDISRVSSMIKEDIGDGAFSLATFFVGPSGQTRNGIGLFGRKYQDAYRSNHKLYEYSAA